MNRKSVLTMVAVAFLVGLCSGCLWSPELDGVRKDIERQLPGSTFKREFTLSLGPVSLGLARTIMRLVPEAAEARGYLDDIRRVKVAIYEASNIPADAKIALPGKLAALVADEGWEIAVRVADGGDNVWLAYRADDETVKDIYVVALSADELVVIRAHGKIDHLVTRAVRERVGEPFEIPRI